jgi:hypothetical protein
MSSNSEAGCQLLDQTPTAWHLALLVTPSLYPQQNILQARPLSIGSTQVRVLLCHCDSSGGLNFLLCRLLKMSAEFVAHRSEQFIRELGITSRTESFIERWGCWHAFVDVGLDRPAAFTRVRYVPAKFRELRISYQRSSREVERPEGDDTASAPDFADVRKVEVVLIVFGIA